MPTQETVWLRLCRAVFISGVFHQFVAPGFSQQGIDEFMKFIDPAALENQLKENYFGLIAASGAKLIGVIEIRDHSHIALFFVEARFQRRGIGKALFRKALEICTGEGVRPSQITVNASPNSQFAYETLGFHPTDVEQCANGIRFVPMAFPLNPVF